MATTLTRHLANDIGRQRVLLVRASNLRAALAKETWALKNPCCYMLSSLVT